MLAVIGAVSVWPSDDQYATELPQLSPAADSAGPEVDGVAYRDSVPNPTRIPTQTADPIENPESTTQANSAFIRLIDPLDEPEHYCVDVPGAGRGVRLESALQAHTCKPIATAADELFTKNHPNDGQIYMEAYDLCVEAEGIQEGASLLLKKCSESHRQNFVFGGHTIRLIDDRQDDLCWTIAPGEGIPTGAPSHLRRALSLESCKSIESTFTEWIPSLTYTRYCSEYDQLNGAKDTCGEWPE